MAKPIRFDLPINGTRVKHLEELRDHFTDEIVRLARSGMLARWLSTRGHLEEAERVTAAVAEHEQEAPLCLALCDIFSVTAFREDIEALFAPPKAMGEQRAIQTLKDAKAQAAEILAQAQKRAAEIVDEAKNDAREEGHRLIVSAQAEIEHETNRAREELGGKIAVLVVGAAEKILKKEIDARAHQSIIDDFARQI